MIWQKLGLIYTPVTSNWWSRSHAMVPTPLVLDDKTIRVFITCCDHNGVGRPSYFDVDIDDPSKVMYVHDEPILDVGIPGSFDDNGVLACSVVRAQNGDLLMYYVGFELSHAIRYRLLTGVAVSSDNGQTFKRLKHTPILERSSDELYFRGGPFCTYDSSVYKMWYVAGSEWEEISGKQMPVYDLRYIESKDGFKWPSSGEVQMEITHKDEHGFGRPYVISKNGSGFELFYSIRRRSLRQYRLGYAVSTNGIVWDRKDSHLNLDVSEKCFDSDAIMYAAPIDLKGRRYVFYNGNNFGKDGVALAVQI